MMFSKEVHHCQQFGYELVSCLLTPIILNSLKGAFLIQQHIIHQKFPDTFVDDSDLWYILAHPTTNIDIISGLKVQAQFWEELLFTIGGKLNF